MIFQFYTARFQLKRSENDGDFAHLFMFIRSFSIAHPQKEQKQRNWEKAN